MNGVCVTRPGTRVWAWRVRSWVCTKECWTWKESGHDGLEQHCRDTALLLCAGPMLYFTCVPTARDWGRFGGSVPCFIAHESHSLGCFFSELADFQTEICTLNENLLYWTLGLASEGYSSCLFSSYRVTDPGISTVEKVIWDGVLFLPKCVSHGEQAACYQRSQAHLGRERTK